MCRVISASYFHRAATTLSDAMRAQTEAFPAYRDAVSKFAAGELDQASAALTIARPLIDDANNLMARAGGSITAVRCP